MRIAPHLLRKIQDGVVFAACLCTLAFTSCGTPGAPQPPSLRLPRPVEDLSATRAASTVTLHWTTPQKNTDRLLIQGLVAATICRREGTEVCQPAGKTTLTAGALGNFVDTLPASLTTGPARPLTYFVELSNTKGHSAGHSNPALVLAGTTPGPVLGLTAEVRADGIALHWQGNETTAIRLHRLLLTPKTTAKKPSEGLTTQPVEPPLRDLLVEKIDTKAPGALDSSVHFGDSYEYTAQRIERISINGGTLELAGDISAPVHADVIDNFPPAIPQGLAAVFVPEEKTIDLSWQPDIEPDLSGYIVYRTENEAVWQRISGPEPIPSPAYRDSTAAAGHSYRYAITAIDQTGHESKRSAEAQESVPNP